MAVDFFVNFDGNCREAVEFYASVFETEPPQFMTFGEAPEDPEYPLPVAVKELIMYSNLRINGSNVMFSDIMPGMKFVIGNNISLTVGTTSKEDIRKWFDRLKEDGEVSMELQETFFSKYYAALTDKYGISWQFVYDDGTM
jgi:PhnB protein